MMTTSASTASVVSQINHLLILAEDADGLFSLFSKTFGLPVAWPMSDYGNRFQSGGVRFGNVTVECIRVTDITRESILPGQPARFLGIALQPTGSVNETLAGLSARGLSYGKPEQWGSWTNVTVTDLTEGEDWIFVCHYPPEVYEGATRLEEQLREQGGGPLGIVGMDEVVIGRRDTSRTEELWSRLLARDIETARDLWRFSSGPALRIEAAERDRILRYDIQVRDLNQTAAFLRGHQLLGEETAGAVTVDPARIGSLQLRFVPVSGA